MDRMELTWREGKTERNMIDTLVMNLVEAEYVRIILF